MRKTADIVIIGGGISGCSTAYHLAKKGQKNIVVLEKRFICGGSTGACGAGVRMQWGTKMNCAFSKYSIEYYEHANETRATLSSSSRAICSLPIPTGR